MHFKEAVFDGQDVILDGNVYERCTFRNCTLRHHGGPFEIRNGFAINGAVNFDLDGGEATIKLLDMIGRASGYIHVGGRTYRAVDEVPGSPAVGGAETGWRFPPTNNE